MIGRLLATNMTLSYYHICKVIFVWGCTNHICTAPNKYDLNKNMKYDNMTAPNKYEITNMII